MEFKERYGPWALVAGASDGVGAAYARAMAERGLDVVLLARRQALLDELAESLRAETGVDTRTLAIDLSNEDAAARVVGATQGLEVGMLLYCAGADPHYAPFLDLPVDAALSMVQRNCIVPLQLCHHFAGPRRPGDGAASSCCRRARLWSGAGTWWPTAPPRPSTW